tara:strand:- start:1453 stop:1587 length:135 start_codon:yes stop_codon:yes gene_type:complete
MLTRHIIKQEENFGVEYERIKEQQKKKGNYTRPKDLKAVKAHHE